MNKMFDDNGKFASPWRGRTQRARIPYLQELKAIAKIADKHPTPERFLRNVELMVKELAEADGVNLEV